MKGEVKTSKFRDAKKKSAPVRLWVKAAFTGFKRSKVRQNVNQSLLKIQGVNDAQSAFYYNGKKVVLVYKAQTVKNNTKYRSIWGKICKPHGGNGMVIAKFNKNLPPKAMGSILRVMLYPNRFNHSTAECLEKCA